MDSLTQIVLGAAVGEAVLGRKIGNKAMLYGAIAGTIPDLDIISSAFVETSRALEIHRGFTHSIVFSLVFAPICAWIVSRYEKFKDMKGWTWLFFWAFFTHPILDAHTTWGTQLFWPFDLRLAFQTIFVIDPLYTVPFLVFLILAMLRNRTDPKRQLLNTLGLSVSTGYLLLTFLLKFAATSEFEKALNDQNIEYQALSTRPAPLNTILWNANIQTEDAYLLADYSFFDSQPISFERYPKNHHLLKEVAEQENIQRMMRISEGWFIVSQEDGGLFFNDLRFGKMGLESDSMDFVFKYRIDVDDKASVQLTEVEKNTRDGKKLMGQLWSRILGN